MARNGRARSGDSGPVPAGTAPRGARKPPDAGWATSIALHVLVLTALAWRGFGQIKPVNVAPSVPVALVTLDEYSNVVKVDPAPIDKKPLEGVALAPQGDGAVPEAGAAQTPVGPPSEPQPVPALDPVQADPHFDPKPPKAERPRQGDDFDLDAISKIIKNKKGAGAKKADAPVRADARARETPRAAIGEATALTASIRDFISAQMYRCWRQPTEQPQFERLIVVVRVKLTPSGALDGEPRLVSPPTPPYGDRSMVVAIESALRAVRLCAPYRLPPEAQDRYSEWKTLDMRFAPQAD